MFYLTLFQDCALKVLGALMKSIWAELNQVWTTTVLQRHSFLLYMEFLFTSVTFSKLEVCVCSILASQDWSHFDWRRPSQLGYRFKVQHTHNTIVAQTTIFFKQERWVTNSNNLMCNYVDAYIQACSWVQSVNCCATGLQHWQKQEVDLMVAIQIIQHS
jgi:hypothetical protein